MSNLTPSILNLDKGLNLQTSKILAPAGSVFDTLNYEQVDFQGHKRIDGYTRYDGSLLPALDEWERVYISGAGAINEGIMVFDSENRLYGIIVGNGFESGFYYFDLAVIDENVDPIAGDTLTLRRYIDGEPPQELDITVENHLPGKETPDMTPDLHYELLLSYTSYLRSRIERLPGAVIGLHWFRDRLHAVADVLAITLEGETPIIHPNDNLYISEDTENPPVAVVLDSYVVGGNRIVFLGTTDYESWIGTSDEIFIDDISGPISAGFVSPDAVILESSQDIASFFEARTEQQVIDETEEGGRYDWGWKFIHHGWEVLYSNGNSLYGSLPSLNQNIQGVGVQGPTDTSGNNGRPTVLTQKVQIQGGQAQVNGWKTSTTPDSYNLDPLALADMDNVFIYADAYITWDGATGAVEAPGLTTGNLTEYPATNNVVVEDV